MRGRRRGPGLVGAMARTTVIAGTAQAASGRVARRQQERWAGQEAAQAPPAGAPATDDPVEQIARLAQLRDQGILTEDEFAAKKAQLLGI